VCARLTAPTKIKKIKTNNKRALASAVPYPCPSLEQTDLGEGPSAMSAAVVTAVGRGSNSSAQPESLASLLEAGNE
jgi:hypothetical protein